MKVQAAIAFARETERQAEEHATMTDAQAQARREADRREAEERRADKLACRDARATACEEAAMLVVSKQMSRNDACEKFKIPPGKSRTAVDALVVQFNPTGANVRGFPSVLRLMIEYMIVSILRAHTDD